MNHPQFSLEDRREAFIRDLASVLNIHSMENGSNTADFILARYLYLCLQAFEQTCAAREQAHHNAQYVPGPNDESGPFVSVLPTIHDTRGKAG